MSYTRDLAQFAAQLRYSDLPGSVIEKAKEILLHAWGVQLAGSTLPWSKAVYRFVEHQMGVPESTVLNYGLKISSVDAAFANGTFGHGFELDDYHPVTGIKGGCVVAPAVLAVGEERRSNGKQCLLATAVAYEVMTRIGLALKNGRAKGAHNPTGVCGPFGAATAAGKLLSFDETTMLHAISIAAGHSAGIADAPATGRGNLKRIFGGMAASNGLRSAFLAKEGLTGPETMLEGDRGFCHSFGDTSNLSALTAGLGTQWQILDVHYKIYAQDGHIQPITEALQRIVKHHNFSPDDIVEIRLGTNRLAHERVIGVIREPKDLTSAQYSANFSVALFLVKGGAGFQDYTEEALSDPKIISLSKKIYTEIDEDIEREFQKTRPRGARVTVKLGSGQTYSECVHNLRQMSAEDVDEKFRRLATIVIASEQCEQLITMIRNLDGVQDISSLIPLLIADERL